VASTVRTPGSGRILLLSVVPPPGTEEDANDHALRDAREILSEALQRSFERGTAPETLFTIATDPWQEIPRVASLHRCETVVLGSPRLDEPRVEAKLEGLISRLGADVVILRAQHRWRIASVRRVLVPIGGRREHSRLRARLLASLSRTEGCHVTFLRTVPPGTSTELHRRTQRELRALARDEAGGAHETLVEEAANPLEAILRHALDSDLIVLGIRRDRATGSTLGDLVMTVARETDAPLVLLGARHVGARRGRMR
jgi:nucleotide-binding universal stress UspA family protein